MNNQDFADAEIIITPGMQGTSFSLAGPKPVKKEYDTNLSPEYLKEYGTGGVFIETGTYRGETVRMVQDSKLYSYIYSIELEPHFFQECFDRFHKEPWTKIIQGESPDIIRDILSHYKEKIETKFTWFLDAHASGNIPGGKYGGSPIIEELEAILQSGFKTHTIFIDDKRLFGSQEWDGVTEERAREVLHQINPNFAYFILDGWQPQDIICATTMKNNV